MFHKVILEQQLEVFYTAHLKVSCLVGVTQWSYPEARLWKKTGGSLWLTCSVLTSEQLLSLNKMHTKSCQCLLFWKRSMFAWGFIPRFPPCALSLCSGSLCWSLSWSQLAFKAPDWKLVHHGPQPGFQMWLNCGLRFVCVEYWKECWFGLGTLHFRHSLASMQGVQSNLVNSPSTWHSSR